MPQQKDTVIHHNPNNNHPTTPRRSPRFLNHNPTAIPPTPNPSNSKSTALKDSTKKPPNQKMSTEYRSGKSRTCAVAVRRSPRFANREEKASATNQNDEKPSKNDNTSGGSRRPAKLEGRDGDGAREEAKRAKEKPVEHCGVASEEVVVEGKKRNGEGNGGGEKKKRKRKRGGKEIAEGWTKEQELALQRAFFSAKPSPHFWKNVSKLVPGKSQQDCFDRIHGDHITPPQSQPRSRAKTIKSSPIQQFSISASKLLKPIDKKVKRSNILKPKNYIIQKSVEKLLQRRLQVDQDREGDIFSVLEPKIDFSTNASQPCVALSTPKQLKENQGLLQSCTETSSSSHKKCLSRFSSSCIANLVSPPVLKQVKNKGLHEKYINQLRCREARRRADSERIQLPVTGKVIGEGSSIQKSDVVEAAKVALVSEARDAINKFQQLQANFMDNTCCSDEDNNDDIGVEYEGQ